MLRLSRLTRLGEGVACGICSGADTTVRLTLRWPNHGGLGNPSTNEEVNYGNCKEEGTSEEGGKEKSQEEIADSRETEFDLLRRPDCDVVRTQSHADCRLRAIYGTFSSQRPDADVPKRCTTACKVLSYRRNLVGPAGFEPATIAQWRLCVAGPGGAFGQKASFAALAVSRHSAPKNWRRILG